MKTYNEIEKPITRQQNTKRDRKTYSEKPITKNQIEKPIEMGGLAQLVRNKKLDYCIKADTIEYEQ